jgi:hypothetical protein
MAKTWVFRKKFPDFLAVMNGLGKWILKQLGILFESEFYWNNGLHSHVFQFNHSCGLPCSI